MDKNRDKFVSGIELRNWIRFQQRKYLVKSTNKKWRENNSNGDDHLSFDELLENTIGAPVTCTNLCLINHLISIFLFHSKFKFLFYYILKGLKKKRKKIKKILRLIQKCSKEMKKGKSTSLILFYKILKYRFKMAKFNK